MTPEQQKIFAGLTKEKEPELHVNSRILIVDSLNTFIRSFAVIQHMNSQLNHIGGLTGYIRSVGYAINLVRPTRVILVFDGKGSSTNKKYIYPDYKANRGITRITNWDQFESLEEESAALTNQIVRLVDYLKLLPVDLLSIDKVEADDVIGYIATRIGDEVTIMSSDRDYLQLVSDRVTVYSPTKKKFYTPELVLKEYMVTPENFLTQKILLGDSGDNVPGVHKLGPKTMIKEFPELGKKEKVSIEEIIEKCSTGKKKAHTNIYNFRNQLLVNRLLMDLENPNIPEPSLEEIHSVMENPNKGFYPREFEQLYKEDDLGNSIPNLQNYLYTKFWDLSKYTK
jgi:DNA polymerase-1